MATVVFHVLCRSTRQDVFNIAGAMYAAVLFLGYGIPACVLLCEICTKVIHRV